MNTHPASDISHMSLSKKLSLIFMGFFISGAIILSILFAATYFLSSGNGFSNQLLTQWLEEKANSKLPAGLNLSLQEARLNREGETLGLKATKLSIKNEEGKILFEAPESDFTFSFRTFLKNPSPLHTLKVKGANLTLVRLENGAITLDTGAKDGVFTAPSLEEAAKVMIIALNELTQNSFNVIQLNQTLITIKDEKDGKIIEKKLLDLVLSKDNQSKLSLILTESETKNELLKIHASQSNHLIQIELLPLSLRASSAYHFFKNPPNKEKFDADIICSSKIIIDSLKQKIITAQAQISLKNGHIKKQGQHPKTYHLNEMSADFNWAESMESVTMERLKIDMLPYKGEFKGLFTNNRFIISQGELAIFDEKGLNPIFIEKLALEGAYDLQTPSLSINQSELKGKGVDIKAKAHIAFTGTTPLLQLDIETGKMDGSAYMRIWPEVAATNVRKWLNLRMLSSEVESSILKTNIPPNILEPDNVILEKDMLLIKAKLKNLSLKPLDDLNPFKANEVDVHVDGKHVKVITQKATLPIDKAKPLDATSVVFEIADTSPKNPQATVKIKVNGESKSLAQLLTRNLFKGASTLSLNPESESSGAIHADITLGLHLAPTLKRESVAYRAEIDFKNFSQTEISGDFDLENANFKVIATQKDFHLKGEGKISGQAANFEIKQPKLNVKPLIELSATLDEKGRSKFGLNSGGRINGLTPLKISSTQEDDPIYKIEVDLTPVSINEIIPGWQKAAGSPSKLKLNAREKDKGWQIDDLHLETRTGVTIKGSLNVDDQSNVTQASLPVYHMNSSDKASMRLEKLSNGYKIYLNASVIDLRPTMKNLLSASTQTIDKNAAKSALFLEAKIGLAAGLNGEMMRNVSMKAQRINGEIRYIEAAGRVGRGAFKAEMQKENKSNWITVSSEDAGSWLRFFDIYNSIQGGYLYLAVAPPKADGSIASGAFELSDFAIKGDAAIGGIVASASLKEEGAGLSLQEKQRLIRERAQRSTGEISSFQKMKAEFSRNARGVITIEEGLINGTAIGATLEGKLDIQRGQMNINGTYVPAYALNNIFGKLPIVGFFLGGGSDQGLIGINYELNGSIKQPELQINPLSALAPGILRRMLDFKGHAAQRARGNAAPMIQTNPN